jgi:hypothetical protein
MRTGQLARAVLLACALIACKSEPAWRHESKEFITKLVDAIDRAPDDCGKLATELEKLEPDARALRTLLVKEGKHLHDFVADDDLQARFFKRDPNPIATCSGSARFDRAIEKTWRFAEDGTL